MLKEPGLLLWNFAENLRTSSSNILPLVKLVISSDVSFRSAFCTYSVQAGLEKIDFYSVLVFLYILIPLLKVESRNLTYLALYFALMFPMYLLPCKSSIRTIKVN